MPRPLVPMPRPLVPVLLAVAALAVAVRLVERQPGSPADRRLVAEARAGYVADELDGRVVAEIRAVVWATWDGERTRYELVVEPSAVGAGVDPIPGFRGVHGVNLQTAHDLERLLAGAQMSVVTLSRDADAGPREGTREGTVGALRRERLPERRLAAEGIDHGARTSRALPVAVTLASGPVPAGRWRTEVRVDGRARLAVEFVAGDGTAHIEAVRSLGEHVPEETQP